MALTEANMSTLKRSFALSNSPPSTPIDRVAIENPFSNYFVPSRLRQQRMSLNLKRRYPFNKSPPLQTSHLSPILDLDVDMSGCSDPQTGPGFPIFDSSSTGILSLRPVEQRQTPPTSIPSSTNCSPTTTISTVDSVATEESSPSECGVAIMPLSPFKKLTGLPSSEDLSIVPPSPGLAYTRSLSPSKKPRNTKNLSLNVPTPTTPSKRPQTSDGDASSAKPSPRSMSAPNSPGFIVPPPQNPRRRPSNLGLTIKLPSTIPEKPKTGVLRHHQSSPSLFSPVTGPTGGMKMPASASMQPRMFQRRPSLQSSLSLKIDSKCSSLYSSPNVSPPQTPPAVLAEMDEEDEEPRSGEARSPAYPDGPVCIFEPNIYLFAEPDAQLASTFDVVINVAREVLDPFEGLDAAKRAELKRPEYIHIPWDHNSSLLEDLPRLVDIIDSRALSGKKVLVHCQCGVSRSASLLIAYGMFKNPSRTVQQSYDAVKSRSKWIGPNMSLIYQLSDWRMQLNKPTQKGFDWKTGETTASGISGLTKARLEEQTTVPQTAPLPERALQVPSPLASPTGKNARILRTGYIGGISPGPSSAPPGMMTIPKPPVSPCPSIGSTRSACVPENLPRWDTASNFNPTSTSAPNSYIPPSSIPPLPAPVAVSSSPQPPIAKAIIPDDAYMSFARRKLQAKLSSQKASNSKPQQQNSSDDEEPPTPSFKSPRNSGYFGFAMSKAGLFGSSPPSEGQTGFVFADPRSPTTNGVAAPVVRSIFDVL